MKHITVNSIEEAWRKANELFPTDYEQNSEYSRNAGYNIYTSTVSTECAWISDLGVALELNFANGDTVKIHIEEEATEEEEEEKTTDEYGNDTELAGELNRLDFCDMLIASLHIASNFEYEARNADNDADRRRAEESAQKWRRLHDKISRQIDAWDAEHGL